MIYTLLLLHEQKHFEYLLYRRICDSFLKTKYIFPFIMYEMYKGQKLHMMVRI